MTGIDHIEELLQSHGLRPTANRLIVARALAACTRPASLPELDARIQTMDRSSLFRTLGAFKAHHLVHVIEDGSDSVKFELCLSHSHDRDDDEHVHFYCEQCNETYCLPLIATPQVTLPAGYVAHSVNYLIKGLCPRCARKAQMR